jgi:hypothetical protein
MQLARKRSESNEFLQVYKILQCNTTSRMIVIVILLYINDLPLNITGSKITLFADDTNILVPEQNINKLQYKINRVMNELQTWFKLKKSCS